MVYYVLSLSIQLVVQHYLGDTVAVPEDDTNLGGGQSLLGQLVDLVLHLVGGELQPLGHRASVGQGRLGDSLPWCVHTTHLEMSNLSEMSKP